MYLGEKGTNQVDLAIAASVLIIIFVFTVSHVSSYYSAPLQVLESSDLRVAAINLEESVFENFGVPAAWHWKGSTTRPGLGTTLWRVPVYLEERNGTAGTWNVSARVEPGTSHGLPNAWNGSIVAYRNGSELPTDVETSETGFLSSFNVTFETYLDAYEEDTVFIYYSQDNMTSAGRAHLSESENHTLNVTVLPERDIKGITMYKVRSLENISFQEAKEKLDSERNFNLSLNTSGYSFSYGLGVPKTESLGSYSQKILFQNSTGHVKIAESKVTVW